MEDVVNNFDQPILDIHVPGFPPGSPDDGLVTPRQGDCQETNGDTDLGQMTNISTTESANSHDKPSMNNVSPSLDHVNSCVCVQVPNEVLQILSDVHVRVAEDCVQLLRAIGVIHKMNEMTRTFQFCDEHLAMVMGKLGLHNTANAQMEEPRVKFLVDNVNDLESYVQGHVDSFDGGSGNPLATHVNRQGSMVVRGSNGDNPATPRDDRSLQTLPTIKILLSLLTG